MNEGIRADRILTAADEARLSETGGFEIYPQVLALGTEALFDDPALPCRIYVVAVPVRDCVFVGVITDPAPAPTLHAAELQCPRMGGRCPQCHGMGALMAG